MAVITSSGHVTLICVGRTIFLVFTNPHDQLYSISSCTPPFGTKHITEDALIKVVAHSLHDKHTTIL
jgi:hypothetical protein